MNGGILFTIVYLGIGILLTFWNIYWCLKNNEFMEPLMFFIYPVLYVLIFPIQLCEMFEKWQDERMFKKGFHEEYIFIPGKESGLIKKYVKNKVEEEENNSMEINIE